MVGHTTVESLRVVGNTTGLAVLLYGYGRSYHIVACKVVGNTTGLAVLVHGYGVCGRSYHSGVLKGGR